MTAPADIASRLRLLIACALVADILFFVLHTLHWPLMWDGQVLHYINFLIDHGFAPYRQIYDMNLPGAYLIDGWQRHLLGPGDLAWRFYDFLLLGILLAAMISIAAAYDWLAGLIAGTLFLLIHASEGPPNAAQRDQVMTTLILAALALAFHAQRRNRPRLLLLFGLCSGFAVFVKPTCAPFLLLVLALLLWQRRRLDQTLAAPALYAVAGLLIPCAVVAQYLSSHGSVSAFLDISTRLTPYYASLKHLTLLEMLPLSLPYFLPGLLVFAVAVAAASRWGGWERLVLLLGTAFGAFSFLIQGKGYLYHRYTFTAFLLLWSLLELTQALKSSGWRRTVARAGLLFALLILIPCYTYATWKADPADRVARSMQSALERLGPPDHLQGRVQCLDMVDGCLSALYRLNLVQSTGFTGDLLFFAPRTGPDDAPAVRFYRQIFWDQIHQRPPAVFLISNSWFNGPRTFDKLNTWPAFADFLARNYTLADTRTAGFTTYRVYLQNQAALHNPDAAAGAP